MILPLPGDMYLVAEDEDGLRRRMREDSGYVRSYCKNEFHTGLGMASTFGSAIMKMAVIFMRWQVGQKGSAAWR